MDEDVTPTGEPTPPPQPTAGPPPAPAPAGPPPPPESALPAPTLVGPPPPPALAGPPPPESPQRYAAAQPPAAAFAPPPGPPQRSAVAPPPPALSGQALAHGPAPRPPKKRHGCLISLGIVLVLVLAIVGGGYALLGGMSAPEDLGVRASEADFDAAVAKAHVDWPELPPGADPADFERVYIGVQPMDVMLTEAELSALMSYRHDPSYWPLSNVQVDLTGPDTARMSAVVTYAGRDWPVYVEGSGGFSGSALFADISAARVGAISVPESFLPTGSDALEAMINDRLARIPGLDVETLDVTAQGVHAIGTIWQTAEYVPVG